MIMMKRCVPLLERKDDTMLNLKRAGWKMAMLLTSFSVIGCAANVPLTKVEKDIAASKPEFCTNALPIYVKKDDVISDATARQILQHNKLGRKLCGW